ncbi:hypothetical protein [Corynebacterium liangguodongii]|uniref:Uncharacterized protein n=1 Tax=Corynebacterium liangguodongii TaxID=2079535 RepID=A0A2S0WGE8_9CORY|nr:hypothetical protein [Corynebacterium liangguodongii]AWB84794.1 hypothetical protein C3E79_10175 [Corynebacterium liangguodongii]PWB99152.1 hypothetical protein DF219_07790 [Corynebacterium liangguodongii]
MRLTTVMPTIPERRTWRIPTIAQLDALGLTPTVVEQDPALPIGHASQLTTAQKALTAGLESGASHILYAEDDIDIDPTITRYLDEPGEGILTFWYRRRFTPRPDGLIPNRLRWISSLAFLCDRATAQRLAAYSGKPGIDMAMRHDQAPLYATPRPMVEHRAVPRAASTGSHITSEGDYQGPNSHHILTHVWEWLPARRDRKRVTTPSIAANALGITPHEVTWAYQALLTMGCVIRDPSGFHRAAPPPWHTTQPTEEDPQLW